MFLTLLFTQVQTLLRHSSAHIQQHKFEQLYPNQLLVSENEESHFTTTYPWTEFQSPLWRCDLCAIFCLTATFTIQSLVTGRATSKTTGLSLMRCNENRQQMVYCGKQFVISLSSSSSLTCNYSVWCFDHRDLLQIHLIFFRFRFYHFYHLHNK